MEIIIGRKVLAWVVAVFVLLSCSSQPEINIDITPKRGFRSNRPAYSWEEALISGNGRMGAMVMGYNTEV